MSEGSENTVAWAGSVEDFTKSDVFARTFSDGMALVEETASYLDGPGRSESRMLPRKAALAYAGESMRLTTRLMQVASWLLVQRAVRDREMSPEEASGEKYRLGAQEICRGKALEASDLLPARLLELLEASERLYDRVERLDEALYRTPPQEADTSPARAAQSLLAEAFGGRES